MIVILIGLVSFIPSILLFLFLRNNHKDDEEYRKNCLSLLGKGVVICLLVVAFDLAFKIPWAMLHVAEKYPWIDRLFTCFIVNALVEETCKFLAARKYINLDKTKTSKLDIISYLVIAALSFGLVEDVVYMLTTNLGQIIVRGVLMGHVPYEMIMGYFYGRAIAEDKKGFKVLAFVIPILLHGTYNFGLTEGLPDFWAIIVVTLVALETAYMIYMIFFIRKKRNDPEYTKPVFPQTETPVSAEEN